MSLLIGNQSLPGDILYMPDAGTLVTKPDGTVWLRSGAIAASASYPAVAALSQAMVHGDTTTAYTTIVAVYDVADNGTGTVVCCAGAANVETSTNSGASWSNQGSFLANATGVCWTGTQFIVACNSATDLYTYTSPDGLTWTLGITQAVTGATAKTAKIRWDSTGLIALVMCLGTSVAVTTANGSVVTSSVTLPTSTGGYQALAVMPSLGVNRWLISLDYRQYFSLTADATTWSTAINNGAYGNCMVINGSTAVMLDNSYNLWTSTTGTGWTQQGTVPSALTNASVGLAKSQMFADGTRVFFGYAQTTTIRFAAYPFGFTSDYQITTIRQGIYGQGSSASNIGMVYPLAGNLLMIGPRSNLSSNWLTSSENIGLPNPVGVSPVTVSSTVAGSVAYMRVA